MTWWIYVIGPVEGWPVKVGYSSNLARRLLTLQQSAHEDLTVFARFPVDSKSHAIRMERLIHKELDLLSGTEWSKRTNRRFGEWFNVFADDAISIAEKAFTYQKKLGALIENENWDKEKSSFYGYIGREV